MIFAKNCLKILLFKIFLILPIWGFAQDYQIWLQGEKPVEGMKPSGTSNINLEMIHNEFEISLINLPQLSQQDKLTKIQNLNLKWKSKNPLIRWSFYYLADHKISKSSYESSAKGIFLDIVIPNEKVTKLNFKIPKENVPSSPWFLLEFFNEANSIPGLYDGELSFEVASKKYVIPIHLILQRASLPSRFKLKTSFGFAPWSVLKKHHGGWNENELALYLKYFELAQDHRIDLHKIYPSFPVLSKEGRVDLKSTQNSANFLNLWKDLYQGKNSSYALKGNVTDLPIQEEMKSNINDKKLKYWSSLNETVKDNDLQDSTYVYFADEPDKLKLIEIKKSLSALKKANLDLNFLLTHHYDKNLDGLINWWCINYHQWDSSGFPTPDFYKERKEKNKKEKVWLYASCNAHGCTEAENNHEPDFVIDRPSSYLRSFPWLATLYNADGILYYDTVLGYDKGEMSPWRDEFNFSGWGEGNLFYPCNEKFCGEKEQYPLASLRLKILRDGLEDAQVIQEALEKRPKLESDLKKFLKGPRSFPNELKDYSRFRAILNE